MMHAKLRGPRSNLNAGLQFTVTHGDYPATRRPAGSASKRVTRMMGFVKPAQIDPLSRKMMPPEGGSLRADLQRLSAFLFKHLIGGHGSPLFNGANEALKATIVRVYGLIFGTK